MFDYLEKQIVLIRKKPEHVRLRYMWGSLVISMLFIVCIWLLSVRINLLKARSDNSTSESINQIQNQITDIQQKAQDDTISIDELLKEQKNQVVPR